MLTQSVTIRLIVGLVAGGAIGFLWPETAASLRPAGSLFGDALRIPVVPVLFVATAAGLYRAAKAVKSAPRIGVVCVAAIAGLTLVGIGLGLTIGQSFQPGISVSTAAEARSDAAVAAVDWMVFFAKAIPSNLAAAAANQDTLAVAVAGALFGLALASLGQRAESLAAGLDTALAALFVITRWIVSLAPIAVVAVIGALVAAQRFEIVAVLVKFVLLVYLGLALMVALLCLILRAIGERPVAVIRSIADPILLAFSLRTTMAVMPLHMERLQRAGMPAAVAETALPLAHVFNRAAASLFIAIAVLTIAQIRGRPIDGGDLTAIAATLLVLSLGAPALPSGSLVVVSATLVNIGLPAGDVAIIAGIDAMTDGPRSGVNVLVKATIAKLAQRFGGLESPDRVRRSSFSPMALAARSDPLGAESNRP